MAAGAASAITATPSLIRAVRSRGVSRRAVAIAAAGSGALLVLAWATGIMERMASLTTLAFRLELWSSSMDAWLIDPLTGLGPGSFPWALQLTDHFAGSGFAARHPDSALVQLLTEAGVLGIVAGCVVVAALVVGIRQVGQIDRRALWGLAFFAAAGIFANPTDLGFLILLGLAWAAVATPPPVTSVQHRHSHGRRIRRGVIWTAAAAVFVAAVTLATGSVVHDQANRLAAAGQTEEADRRLALAIALDPGMALYPREMGVSLIERGRYDEAAPFLDRATELNPADTIALRAASELAMARGEPAAALAAAKAAARLMRSSTNVVLTLARAEAAAGHVGVARRLITEAVAVFPALLALDFGAVGIPVSNDELLDSALALWMSGEHVAAPAAYQYAGYPDQPRATICSIS